MRVWRIARTAHAALDGEGARRYGSRWTPRGLPAIFTSATLSLAALERFVHTDTDLELDDLVSIAVDIPPDLKADEVDVSGLPRDWRAYPAPPALAQIGERWLRLRQTLILSVPSVVVPEERNFVINPRHSEFSRLEVHPARRFSFDARMWKSAR